MSRRAPEPRVFSIPPQGDFLAILADRLLDGTLVPGFRPASDPLTLTDATIWLPTRRAARSLGDVLADRMGGTATLLPAIRVLGEGDADDAWLEEETGSLVATAGKLQRQLYLARMIEHWAAKLNETQRALLGGEEVVLPASFADAVGFAGELARLMDMVATEEADWAALDALVPDDFGKWWQLTLQFLKIATVSWPHWLHEQGLRDAATERVAHLRRQAATIRQHMSNGPIIAAGSTGSIPATADFLAAIAHHPLGAVVLPGLDRTMGDALWERIDLPDNEFDDTGTAPGHPQYGLRLLMRRMQVLRGAVRHLGTSTIEAAENARESLISLALLPSDETRLWRREDPEKDRQKIANALEGLALMEAETPREEALAIALALRETLEEPEKRAALVTPDRNLARRVATALCRFGILVDDSAGTPLTNAACGRFLSLVAETGFGEADNLTTLSLIKHPLAGFGLDHGTLEQGRAVIEEVVFRGALAPVKSGTFVLALEKATSGEALKDRDAARRARRFTPADLGAGKELAARLDEIFAPATDSETCESGTLITWTIGLVEACAEDPLQGLDLLYGDEAGRALRQFLADLLAAADGKDVDIRSWPAVLATFMGGISVRRSGSHPRLQILGPIEARLQGFDRVILGGLNEKTWPQGTSGDPFLSRPMKTRMKLPPPERRTGLAAHDFQMLVGHRDALLSRSKRLENEPAIASRWVQRLLAMVGETQAQALRNNGARHLSRARMIDRHDGPPERAPRPQPAPPLHARPIRFSVTEIEKLINDPYSVYADRVLDLRPLDPLSAEAGPRERGTLYHGIFEEFVRADPLVASADPKKVLFEIATRHLDAAGIDPAIAAQWRPRLYAIGELFIDWQRNHGAEVDTIHVERMGEVTSDDGRVTLRGKADRIDMLKDGTAAIIDYKTGVDPAKSAVETLSAPQMPLEAAMLARGGFAEIGACKASELIYIRLKVEEKLKVDAIDGSGKESVAKSAHELGEAAWQRFNALMAHYGDPQSTYISKARPPSEARYLTDYDHLARLAEWSLVDDGGEGGEGAGGDDG